MKVGIGGYPPYDRISLDGQDVGAFDDTEDIPDYRLRFAIERGLSVVEDLMLEWGLEDTAAADCIAMEQQQGLEDKLDRL